MLKEDLIKKIQEGYTALGEAYYNDHKDDNSSSNKYKELFDNIRPFFVEYEGILDVELAEKGLKRCPRCGKTPPAESLFCNMCGYDFRNEKADAVKEEVEEVPPTPVVRKCPHCGAELEADSAFCSTCGRPV